MFFFGAPEGGMYGDRIGPRSVKERTLAECPRAVFGYPAGGRKVDYSRVNLSIDRPITLLSGWCLRFCASQ
jgi:hypothetical protein